MRSGTIALVGRPNVGKSTLLNALAGEDVSIATPKPETTRQRIVAIVTTDDAQGVFVDTPGIHRPRAALGKRMNDEALAGARDADVVVVVADGSMGREGLSRDRKVLEAVAGLAAPVVLALNKVDLVRPKSQLLPMLEAYGAAHAFAEVVPVSSLTGDGVENLRRACMERLPEGPALFPSDALTDRPERFLAAERIRAAVILETAEEIPYAAAVEIEKFDERAPILHIQATIHVERAGQKKIVVGKAGERIRAIGTRARKSIEHWLGRKVFLELWVKVSADWTRSAVALDRLGYGSAPRSERTARGAAR